MSRPRSRASSSSLLGPEPPTTPTGSGSSTGGGGAADGGAAGPGAGGICRRGGSVSPHPLKAIERGRRRATFLLLTVSLALLGCLGARCLYHAGSSSRLSGSGSRSAQGPLNGSWRYGRYHDHVSGLEPGSPAYRDLLLQAAKGTASDCGDGLSWAAAPAATQVQCPAFNASRLPAELWGPGRGVYVAANLRDNEGVMANFIRQLAHLARLLSPTGTERRLFVSVYESNSADATPQWLEELRAELGALGVPHEVVSGGEAEARAPGEDRIAFLARMRNRAMAPLYEGRARAGPQQDEHFGHVVFVNDVFFCAYEVLRLLMYGADLACGVDLFLEPDPAKYLRKGQPEAAEVRKELTFYDLWVARDIRGRRFQWAPPFALHVAPAMDAEEEAASAQRRYSKRKERGWETEPEFEEVEVDRGGPLGLPEYREAFPAFCCWNGLAVLGAEPFYRGLRFRSTRPGQGVLSECSNLCLDLWANGYSSVVVDPQVKLAYDEPTYERIQTALPPRYPDLHQVRTPHPVSAPPPTLSTCHLETGARKQGSMVRFEECRDDLPTATALAQAGPRMADLCFGPGLGVGLGEEKQGLYWGRQRGGDSSSNNHSSQSIPRALLQLAPFPLAPHEAAMDEAQAPPGAASLAWHQRWRLGKEAARRAEAERVLALARGPREWRSLWEDWRRLHVDAPARLYGKAEAEAVLLRHFPLAGPVLRRLEARGEWAAWRALASLALLYHHGGVLVPPARYRPRRSLDCVLLGEEGGLQLDLHAVHAGLVDEVMVEDRDDPGAAAAAWGPDLGVVAAPRHDQVVRRAVERLFFSEEALRGEFQEEAVVGVLQEEAARLEVGGVR